MNHTTENLFKEIKTGTIEEKLNSLLVLGDDIEFAHFKLEIIRKIVQRLINVLSRETESKVIKLLFRNITIAYMHETDLSKLNYDPLINILDKAGPNFICSVLYILSMTYDSKYVPIVSKYTDHPDETVRQEAKDAMSCLGKL